MLWSSHVFSTRRARPADAAVTQLNHAPNRLMLEPMVLSTEVRQVSVARVTVELPIGRVVDVALDSAPTATREAALPVAEAEVPGEIARYPVGVAPV